MTAILDPPAILAILDRGTRIHSGICAAADLRELRLNAATPGPWTNQGRAAGAPVPHVVDMGPQSVTAPFAVCHSESMAVSVSNATLIAAEANPDHVRAAIHRWRRVVERHVPKPIRPMFPQDEFSPICAHDGKDWPCADVLDTAGEVRAYLTTG